MAKRKYRTGTRICVPLGKTGRKVVCGKITGRKIGRFRDRKIFEYKVKFDDGGSGLFHSPEFRKERK